MSLKKKHLFSVFVLLWAGACVSGNLIAAPAKFQVTDLSMPVALQVGRMQFLWIGYLEYILAGLVFIISFSLTRKFQILIGIPILLFLLQRYIFMPQLSFRTDLIVAGQSVAHSNIHIYFIIAEICKVIGLLYVGVLALSFFSRIKDSD